MSFGSEPDASVLQPSNLPKIPAQALNPRSDFQTNRSVGLQLPDLSDLYDRVYNTGFPGLCGESSLKRQSHLYLDSEGLFGFCVDLTRRLKVVLGLKRFDWVPQLVL